MIKKKDSAGLQIVVCIKPVPDPAKWDKLKLDPVTMLLNRGQVPAVINALDLNAIEEAVQIKRRCGGRISVLTMAPPEAEDQLREALAMGCDQAFLLTDRAFAGADTLATARCLAAAIAKIGPADLVFCGGYSLDGSTAQVGPQLAELLGIPDLTHVVRLEVTADGLRAACKVEGGTLHFEAEFPALVTFDREANSPRLPGMAGIRQARDLPLARWNAADLGLAPEQVGLKGSPTQMFNVFTPAGGRKGEMLQGTPAEMAGALIARLQSDKVLD